MNEINDIDELIKILKSMKSYMKKNEKLKQVDIFDVTQKRAEKVRTDITWNCMEIDKLRHAAHAKAVDLMIAGLRDDYSDIVYEPSCFHRFNFKKPLPRQLQE